MSYFLGQMSALEKLGYDINDATKVLGATKKYMLPKASNRTLAGITGHGALPKEMLSPMSVGGKRQIEETGKMFTGLADQIPRQKNELLAAGQMMGPGSPAAAMAKGMTADYRMPGVITPGASDYRKLFTKHIDKTRVGGPSTAGQAQAWTPDQYKMLNSIVRGHEMDETVANMSAPLLSFGHKSPSVMLREHNRVTTMPQEFAPVKELLQKGRALGEAPLLKNDIGLDYGESPRLSRHAIKRLTQLMEKQQIKHTNKLLDEMARYQT